MSLLRGHRPIEDVHNPFALVHLRAFLRRHVWWMILLPLLALPYLKKLYTADRTMFNRDNWGFTFEPVEPDVLQFSNIIVPYPAIDPYGRYVIFRSPDTDLLREYNAFGALNADDPKDYAYLGVVIWDIETSTPLVGMSFSAGIVADPLYSAKRRQLVCVGYDVQLFGIMEKQPLKKEG